MDGVCVGTRFGTSAEEPAAFVIDDLDTGREYNVQVQLFNPVGGGPPSDSLHVRTVEAAPLQAPTNLQSQVLTSTSVRVAFDYPPLPTRRGLLRYRVFGGPTGTAPAQLWTCDASPCNVTGLSPSTEYTLFLVAFNTAGTTAPSGTTVVHTLPAAPRFLVTQQDADEDKGEAVTLLWQVPTGSNDPIVTYTIYIRERCVVNGEVYNGGQRAVFKWDWGGVREGDVCEARKKPIA